MTASELPHGRSRYRHHGCRCEVCVGANRAYMREHRARKRGLTPVPSLLAEPVSAETEGPAVAAVRADVAGLGELRGYQYLVEGALAMARILDDHRLASTQPAAVKQLASLLGMLHREAAPKRGRLAAVQAMTGDRS
jgi:hypothetical protein